MVCTATALFFDQEQFLLDLLSMAGNDRWRDRVVKIPNVLREKKACKLKKLAQPSLEFN